MSCRTRHSPRCCSRCRCTSTQGRRIIGTRRISTYYLSRLRGSIGRLGRPSLERRNAEAKLRLWRAIERGGWGLSPPEPAFASGTPTPTLPRKRERGNSIQLCFHAALDARARHHRVVPAADMGEIRERHLVALVPPGPTEDRKVGNR